MSFHPAAPSDKSFKLVQKANDLFERHHYAEAVTEYTKALSNSKDALDSYLALAYSNRSASYIKLRQYEKARLDAVKVMTLSPKWSKGYFRHAEALVRLAKFDEAIKYYKLAIDNDPQSAKEIASHITKAFIEKDNYEMGIEIIQLVAGIDFAIERNPLNPIHNKLNELASHMKNIIHLIVDRKTKSCIVVDACWDIDGILKFVDDHGYTIVSTIVTHYHFDHVGGSPPPPYDNLPIKISGLAALLKKLPHIKAYIHPRDIPFIQQANSSIPHNKVVPTCTDITEELNVGSMHIRFIHTPGHTPGSQSVLVNGARLLMGDVLLCGGLCGRTDLPGGDRRVMEHTLRHILGPMDNRIVVYPGHDYGTTWSTIGIERENGCLGDDLVGFGME